MKLQIRQLRRDQRRAGRMEAAGESDDLKKPPALDDVWREVKQLVWARRRRLLLGLALMIVSSALGLALPFFTKILIDDVFLGDKPEILTFLAVGAGFAVMFQAVTAFWLTQLLGVTAQRSITEMRKRVQRHVARLPISFFDSNKSGVLISRIMTDAEGIRNLVGTGLVQIVRSVLTGAVALILLFYFNWSLTLITCVVLVFFGGGMVYAFGRLRPLFRERGRINAEVTGRLAETLGGIRIVKAYTAEKREELVFAKGAHLLFRNVAKAITAVAAVTSLSRILFGGVAVLMIILGGRDILDGTWGPGDFAMYVLLSGMVIAPMINIASIGTQLSEAFAGLDRIRELLRMDTEDKDDDKREPLADIRGEVKFENVWFEYDSGVPVLKDISLMAPAGTTTALVGSSGSGKSTLISLVMTFNRPLSGRIEIDGRDLNNVRLGDYRSQLGIVLQDNFLFDGTIAENIRFSRPDADIKDVVEVSRIAHCDEFIESFEHAYDTIVGERGIKLSGGQRQRIAIARAILADPKILILDEATSSLDSESEAFIQDGLRKLREGRTTFVIAHRLSTIRSADQILVLEDGRIFERGTHDELLAVDGRYRTLYDKQYKFEHDRFINPGEDFTPEPVRESIPVQPGTTRKTAL